MKSWLFRMAINISEHGIPTGWKECLLPEFARIVMGQSPSSETYNLDGIGLPFFQGKAEFSNVSPRINKYCSKPNKIANLGATLLSVRAPVGPTNLASQDCCIGRGLAAIHPYCDIDPKFILYIFRSVEPDLSDKGTGSTFKAITKTFVEELKFAIPPLAEQHRIVAKIEELFSELDKGIESLKKAREQLKVYRQAVLKHAFEGKLTEKWREENKDKLETADQLLARIQKEREIYLKNQVEERNAEARRFLKKTNKNPQEYPDINLPSGAIWVNFLDLCTFVVDCHNKTAPYQKDGIYLIRTPCIRDGKIYLNEDARFISQETYEYWSHRCPPEPGDIILTREAPMGEAGIVPADEKICMGQRMMLLRPPNCIDSKYILYCIMEPLFQSRLAKESIGTGVKHLRVGDVEKFCIPFFSLREQREIVAIVESILSVIEEQEHDLDIVLKQSEALRQSILKKAFSGQLVEQDPNDEPASVLLERIKAEKEKQIKSASKKKTTKKRKTAA